jgi:hypothetical protein
MIRGGSFPPFSCREAEQTLTPLQTGELRRTINGELCYIGASQHHKYQTSIKCQDRNNPALQHLWVGAEVEVECLARLWESHDIVADDLAVQLSRPYVLSSVEVINQAGHAVEYEVLDNHHIKIPVAVNSSVLIGYAPILKMRIKNFQYCTKEWAIADPNTWQIDLEEI